jgi:hypothetical protein
LVCSEVPEVVLSVTRAVARNDLAATYAGLPDVDFSRDILARHANRLMVVRDSGSGWADLGSAKRVMGLLAKNADQPAWFRQTRGLSPHFRMVGEIV